MSSSMVEKTGQIHAIGYGLEDVSFEAERDFRVRVAGIDVSARRGETSKMPYWVGRALEENGYGRVNLPDMITALKQALAKERIGGPREFQALEPLFYVKLKASMRRLEGRNYDRVYDMLLELFRMRNAKIVTKASSMKMSMEMKRRLTVEEQAFYADINGTCDGFEARITDVSSDFDDDHNSSGGKSGSGSYDNDYDDAEGGGPKLAVTDLSGGSGGDDGSGAASTIRDKDASDSGDSNNSSSNSGGAA